MRIGGINFGAHTLTHPDLTTLSFKDIEHEIRKSKEIIEDILTMKVSLFAYPYGKYDNINLTVARNYFMAPARASSD